MTSSIIGLREDSGKRASINSNIISTSFNFSVTSRRALAICPGNHCIVTAIPPKLKEKGVILLSLSCITLQFYVTKRPENQTGITNNFFLVNKANMSTVFTISTIIPITKIYPSGMVLLSKETSMSFKVKSSVKVPQ